MIPSAIVWYVAKMTATSSASIIPRHPPATTHHTVLCAACSPDTDAAWASLSRSIPAHSEMSSAARICIILTVRSLVREMSVKSGVPVEPPVITELLDFCSSMPGVAGEVALGAGGYDAVHSLASAMRNPGPTNFAYF
jgi:hypothetical protein